MTYSKSYAGTSDGGVSLPTEGLVVHRDPDDRDARIADLERVLTNLLRQIRKVGGYSTPEDQADLREAERVLGGGR